MTNKLFPGGWWHWLVPFGIGMTAAVVTVVTHDAFYLFWAWLFTRQSLIYCTSGRWIAAGGDPRTGPRGPWISLAAYMWIAACFAATTWALAEIIHARHDLTTIILLAAAPLLGVAGWDRYAKPLIELEEQQESPSTDQAGEHLNSRNR